MGGQMVLYLIDERSKFQSYTKTLKYAHSWWLLMRVLETERSNIDHRRNEALSWHSAENHLLYLYSLLITNCDFYTLKLGDGSLTQSEGFVWLRCAGLGTREDQGFTSKPWSQLVAFQVGNFPMRFFRFFWILKCASSRGDPSFPWFLCVFSTAAGVFDLRPKSYVSKLCRLCCGSSSSAVLTGAVVSAAPKLHSCFSRSVDVRVHGGR